ncbi:hypothetical protein Tco_0217456 [Tanacetum coccineum]
MDKAILRWLVICVKVVIGWVPNFSTMKMLVVGLAKGAMVQEARELVGQMKERFPEKAHMRDEVEEILSKSEDA